VRPVPGYEGLYAVTDDGRVYSERSGRFIGGYRNRDGYVCAVLCRPGGRWFTGVHHLVALAWLGDPGVGFEVNHRNGRRDDNRAANLEWVTHRANCQADRALNLVASRCRGSTNGAAKFTDHQIVEVHRLRRAGFSQMRIKEATGISQPHVSRILRGENRASM
jgi:hypothetical protein